MSESKTFKWHAIVDFVDTDAGGVVYHTRYLEWAERARASWLRDCNLSNQQLWQQGIVFVVTRVEIDYKQSARLDEEIIIETTITKMKGVRIVMKQDIYRQEDRTLLCNCIVTLALIDRHKHKPTKIPLWMNQAFSS